MAGVAGGVFAAAAAACGGAGGGQSPGDSVAMGTSYVPQRTVAPAEVVAVGADVTYDNVLPDHVPFARWPRATEATSPDSPPEHKL